MLSMELMENAINQGIWSAIVVGIYLVIAKIIDTYKDIVKHNKEVEKEKHQIKINQQLVDSISAVSDFINDTTKNILDRDKEKCVNAIKNSFKGFANTIIKFGTDTIIANHIETNKINIIDNIEHIVNTEYYTLYSTLSLYKINNISISNYIKSEWKEEIKETIIQIIYADEMNKEQKLYNLNNKINIKVNDYCIYVTNKYLDNER